MPQKGTTKLITHHKVTAPQSQSQASRAIRAKLERRSADLELVGAVC
jgi:hypothetical protein